METFYAKFMKPFSWKVLSVLVLLTAAALYMVTTQFEKELASRLMIVTMCISFGLFMTMTKMSACWEFFLVIVFNVGAIVLASHLGLTVNYFWIVFYFPCLIAMALLIGNDVDFTVVFVYTIGLIATVNLFRQCCTHGWNLFELLGNQTAYLPALIIAIVITFAWLLKEKNVFAKLICSAVLSIWLMNVYIQFSASQDWSGIFILGALLISTSIGAPEAGKASVRAARKAKAKLVAA